MRYLILVLAFLFGGAQACEKEITVKLSQTHFTLDLWEHAKDAMNTVEFKLPVSCSFYDEVKVGDSLLTDKFRGGSLLVNGSIGNWNLDVIGK